MHATSTGGSHLNATWRRLFRGPAYLYRWRCGWVLGHRFLLLIHTGRNSGLRRHTVLEVMEYRKQGPELIVISGWGRNADWLRNIQAQPSPEVVVGSRRFIASYRFLNTEDAISVVASYERRHRFITPVVRAVLSKLVGWKYDGSESARRRLVAQLPLISFRPRP